MTNKQIVALSIDKVQSFLFETIHAHVQEKQTEEATLKSIMNSSREISIDFFNTVEEAFGNLNIKRLMTCSGVFIFECTLPEDIIEEKLNTLFLHYYFSSQGQKQLRFVLFPAEGYEDISAIQEAKKRLKEARYLNTIIEKNRDVLFSFQKVDPPTENFEIDAEEYPMFAKNINALFSSKEADNENRFRIAVIKADLDGMANMFKGIRVYSEYLKKSEILNECISLKELHRVAEACWPAGHAAQIFPFYIAGDDIFFAVSVSNLSKGIDVCRMIVKEVNERLCNIIPSRRLSMSIGVELTFNRQPIRYYLDMVEKQLRYAKASCPGPLKECLETKISIGGLTFFDINLETKKELKNNGQNKLEISKAEVEKPIWQYFLHDLRLISQIKTLAAHKEKLGTSSFFYALLEIITNESISGNDIKYINHLLYHLLPEYLDNPDATLRNLELLLKTALIRQLYQKDENGEKLVLNDTTKHRLETYLRLMLLFSDPRFNISQGISSGNLPSFHPEDIKSVRKYLFTKPLDYLYNHSLTGDLRKVFVSATTYSLPGKKRKFDIPCFQRLHIEKSMFIKIRNMDKVPTDKAAEMIELKNPTSKNEINAANKIRSENGKAPYHLYYDKETFLSEAEKNGKWNSDYVDSLMLFYGYNEMSIRFKGLYPNKKKER